MKVIFYIITIAVLRFLRMTTKALTFCVHIWLHCNWLCTYRKDKKLWHCRKSVVMPISKKRRVCSYTISDFKWSFFLDSAYILPWKIVLFVFGIIGLYCRYLSHKLRINNYYTNSSLKQLICIHFCQTESIRLTTNKNPIQGMIV